jgi:hypothetical protein
MMPMPARKRSWMCFSTAGLIPRPPERLARLDSPLEAGVDTLTEHAALKLSERACNLEHQATGWRRGVYRLLVEIQVNAAGFQRLNSAEQVNQ